MRAARCAVFGAARRWRIALCACALLVAAAAPWPAADSNPQPLPGDLVLPMPCGGSMAFRAVPVPSEGVLSDQRIVLGGLDKQQGYKEYQHAGYIAGGFAAPDHAAARVYYLGKYDVTRLQFAALGPTCPTPGADARMPQTGVTWAEAASFADGYTAWLIAHAKELAAAGKPALPAESGQPGFMRLPTEEEWEYAARGGAAVADADFAAPLPPMPDGLAKYAWYGGTESANGRVQPVGLLKPNPLGLFDMLGDVRQFALAPFRLNHLSRLGGDAGGFVVRGTDYQTPAEQVRSAARDEFVPYDARGPRRADTVGFRLAIAAPVLPDLQRLRQVKTAWDQLPDSSAGTLAEPAQTDPVKEADALASAVDDPALKRRLQSLGVVIAASIKTRDEQRDRAAKAGLELASWLGVRMQKDMVRVLAQQHVALLGPGVQDPAEARLIAQRRAELRGNIDAYRDLLHTLYVEYPSAVRDAQAAVLRDQLAQQQKPDQAAAVAQAGDDIAAIRRDGDLTVAALEKRLRAQQCATDDGRKLWQDACRLPAP